MELPNLKIIGHIETDFAEKFGVPRQSGLAEELTGRIVFCPEYRDANAFRGLEGFTHLWLIWLFSETVRENWRPMVHPPRLGGNTLMGVFATRAPYRPNPIGLSCVKLESLTFDEKDGPVLTVRGADLVSGTPILDVKPYLPYTDSRPDASDGFAGPLRDYRLDVTFPQELLARIPEHLRAGLLEVLAQDPRPQYHDDPTRRYGFGFAGMDVRFTVEDGRLTVVDVVERRGETAERAIRAELSRLSEKWDVWAENCSTGETIHCTWNLADGEPMVAASVIKLFVMGAVYERIEGGEVAERDVESDLSAMITVSDNDATNRLIRLLGGGDADAGRAAVNEWASSIGCEDVRLNRLMLANNGQENYVTARDCALLLRRIREGTCVSSRASAKMLDLLRAQRENDRIPMGLPHGATAAHKTGSLAGLCVADVGILFLPDRDLIACFLCNGPVTKKRATAEIVTLTKIICEKL